MQLQTRTKQKKRWRRKSLPLVCCSPHRQQDAPVRFPCRCLQFTLLFPFSSFRFVFFTAKDATDLPATVSMLTIKQQHHIPRRGADAFRAILPPPPTRPDNLAHRPLSLRQIHHRRRARAPTPALPRHSRLPPGRRQHPLRPQQGPGIQRARPQRKHPAHRRGRQAVC